MAEVPDPRGELLAAIEQYDVQWFRRQAVTIRAIQEGHDRGEPVDDLTAIRPGNFDYYVMQEDFDQAERRLLAAIDALEGTEGVRSHIHVVIDRRRGVMYSIIPYIDDGDPDVSLCIRRIDCWQAAPGNYFID